MKTRRPLIGQQMFKFMYEKKSKPKGPMAEKQAKRGEIRKVG